MVRFTKYFAIQSNDFIPSFLLFDILSFALFFCQPQHDLVVHYFFIGPGDPTGILIVGSVAYHVFIYLISRICGHLTRLNY